MVLVLEVKVPVITNGVPLPSKVIVSSLASYVPAVMVKTLLAVMFPVEVKVVPV